MYTRFPAYTPILLFLMLAASASCERRTVSPTSPSPSNVLKPSLTAEPLEVRPEFLQSSSCPTRPPFGIRITVVVGGGNDVILRGIRFAFTDRFGRGTLPDVFPTPEASTSIPSSSPIPIPGAARLPGSSPIPIPGASPINGVFLSDRMSLPFFLRFACGVLPEGTIVVTAELADKIGRFDRTELRVAVR